MDEVGKSLVAAGRTDTASERAEMQILQRSARFRVHLPNRVPHVSQCGNAFATATRGRPANVLP